jgi:DNA-directed RNA polymerase delta subunit
MFSSPRLSRTSMDLITTKRILDEKCQTIEQLKNLINELKLQHEKKEQELIKRIGFLYNDLQQNKKKMAHLILKYQKQKKVKYLNLIICI